MNEGRLEKIKAEEVWLKFEGRMRAFILSKIHDEAKADDLMQELFIRIHGNIDKVSDEVKLQSWIYQICRNLITDHFRSVSKSSKGGPALIPEEEDHDEDLMSEALEDMINMMSDLPGEYCEALCKTELGSLSQKAYAEHIGMSYSGVKSRVQRARNMLKDMLMRCCHYEFDKYGNVIEIHPVNCCCCPS